MIARTSTHWSLRQFRWFAWLFDGSGRRSRTKDTLDPLTLWKTFESDPDKVFEYAIQEAEGTIKWYRIHARRNRLAAWILRWLAAVLLAAAGVLPVLSELLADQFDLHVAPTWSTILIAASVLLVALDQISGCSSKYMEFKSAQIRIRKLLKGFVFDMLQVKHTEAANLDSQSLLGKMIPICANFNEKVGEIVLKETGAWIDDFKGALRSQETRMNANPLPSQGETGK